MALKVIDQTTVAVIRAAMSSQTAQRDALVAQFAGANVTVQYKRADDTTVEVDTHGPMVPNSLTPRGFTLGPLLASTVVISGQVVTHAAYRNASAVTIYTRDAADLALVSPTTLTGRRINGADEVLGKQLVTALASLPVTSTPTYLLTFTLDTAALINTDAAGSIVNTGNAAVAWSITPPSNLTVTPSSGTLAAGNTQALVVRATVANSYSVTLVAAGATITGGNPQTFAAAAPGSTVATMTLTAPTTATHPFALMQAFRQGDIPSGSGIVVTGATAQATIKNAWPDGSAKLAVIAGTAALTAATPATLTFAPGAAATGTDLTTIDLKAALTQPVTVDAGAFGSASWSGTDWDTPFQTWVAGHRMSSWIYRKPVGSDAHLVAWLEVRLFAGGAVEVLPWVENGYLRVAGPTNKSATYAFTLGGTSRFSAAIDIPHHCRTPLVSGSTLSHWLGADPAVTPLHDAVYLQATELVPTYAGVVAADAAVVTALPSAYTPLQAGSFVYSSDDMSSSGYQAPIGLLPQHDVLHLTAVTAARPATYAAVIRNGYSAGRYALHARDDTTNRPPAFSTYPTLVWASGGIKDAGASTTNTLTPASTGTAPPLWDTAHAPSVGFMAYLLTGRFYFMEEVQFAATTIHFSVTDWVRGGGISGGAPAPGYTGASGIVSSYVQLRAGAWWMRALAQALCVTPTSDPLLTEFKNSVQNTVNFHHAKYVVQSNNPFGFVQPDVDYGTTGIYRSSPWMQDFYTAAFGYAKAMGLPLDSTPAANLTAFFAWTAQSVVGRLGTSASPDWWYINAAPYTIAVAPTDTPNWVNGTGPWYASWRAMYDATAATEPNRGSTEGLLAGSGEAFPETTNPSTWHNLQPALAYAVRFGVSGASAAYARMTSATNWASMTTLWNTKPVWSTRPASGAQPAWASAGLAVNEAIVFPSSAIPYGQGPGSRLSYSGIFSWLSKIYATCGGGHNDCKDNGGLRFDYWQDSPAWVEFRAAWGGPWPTEKSYYQRTPTVQPSSRHTYGFNHYNPLLGKGVLTATAVPWGNSSNTESPATNTLDLETGEFEPAGTYPDTPGCFVQRTDGRYMYGKKPNSFWTMQEVDVVAKTVVDLPAFSPTEPATQIGYPMAHDPGTDTYFQCSYGDGRGGGPVRILYRYAARFASRTAITFNPSAAATALLALADADATMFFIEETGKFHYWSSVGPTMYVITPNAGTIWDVETAAITVKGTGAALPAPSHSHSRGAKVRLPNGWVGMGYLANDTGNTAFIRLH